MKTTMPTRYHWTIVRVCTDLDANGESPSADEWTPVTSNDPQYRAALAAFRAEGGAGGYAFERVSLDGDNPNDLATWSQAHAEEVDWTGFDEAGPVATLLSFGDARPS